MIRTATLTFQNAENYGAILQAYALQKSIIKLGVDNVILNYSCEYMGTPYGISALKRKGIIRYFLGIAYAIVRLPRKPRFQNFRNEMKLTKKINYKNLKDIENNYDFFIVGSDQVWNDSITNLDPSFFLNFIKNSKKKLSYAASFGFENIPHNLKNRYKDLLKSFNVFNMREQSGVRIIQSLLNKKSNLVLDPTLLLDKNEWNLIANKKKNNQKYILVYQITISSFLINTVKKISKQTGYKVISIPFPLGGFLNASPNLSAGPKEWISLFRDAEIVITDSFHGCCFSILYNKKFKVCITGAATRIYSLLKLLRIEESIHNHKLELDLSFDVDWNSVNKILLKERNKSIKALSEMFNG